MRYMKLVCCMVMCFCFLIGGCGTSNNNDKGEFWTVAEGERSTTVQDLREAPAYEKNLEMDAELALKIGDAVLEATYGAETLAGFAFIVTDHVEEGWFKVCRMPDWDIYPGVLDGGYNVAILKKTGEIIKIWQDG